MIDNGSTSDFVALGPVDISGHFSEMEEIPTKGFNVLVRAKRFGQWWMLKGLKSEYRQDLVYQEMLSKEYDILTRVQHSDVVAVEGMEEVDGYGKCIVMEWVDGETLAEWLKQPHSSQEKRKLIGQLLDAVEYIHRCQVVHRDLKPSNIMITRNGQHVKLIDFGLADTDSYAVFKQPAGTVGYIAPEQLSGSATDCRNDIYSIGVILEQMLLGCACRKVAKKCQRQQGERYEDVASLRKAIRSSRRTFRLLVALLVLLMVLIGGGFCYPKWMEPRQAYDVVADFKVGYLQYQSWGGGLATVRSVNDVDSCVEIPPTVTYEGIKYVVNEVTFKAFENHHHLCRIVFPDGELHFMAGAFKGCSHLREIYFRSSVPSLMGNKIWNVDIRQVFDASHFDSVVLYVPKGCVSAYRQSEWKYFKTIKEYH